MPEVSDSSSLWLKLFFILTCCLLAVLAIAVLATTWASCGLRKQVKLQQLVDNERGAFIVHPWMQQQSPCKSTKVMENGHDYLNANDHEVVQSAYRPCPSFDISHSHSDASPISHKTQHTVLIPPKPDLNRSQRPSLSVKTSTTTLPYPPLYLPRSKPERDSEQQDARGDRASLVHRQAVSPGEVTCHSDSTHTHMPWPYTRQNSDTSIQQVYMPYRNAGPTSVPPELHPDSLQVPCEPLSASSNYSHPSHIPPESPNPSIDLDKIPSFASRTSDTSSQITAIPVVPPLVVPQSHYSNHYSYPPSTALDYHNISTRPFNPDRACSEPPSRHGMPQDLILDRTRNHVAWQRKSEPALGSSPEQIHPTVPNLDINLAPLPLALTKCSELRGLGPRPVPARGMGPMAGMGPHAWVRRVEPGDARVRSDAQGWERFDDRFSARGSTVSMAREARIPKKLQKRKDSEGYMRAMAWLSW